jgi:hypothetical protein
MGKVKDEIDKMLEKSLLIPAAQNYPESSIKIQYQASKSSIQYPATSIHSIFYTRSMLHAGVITLDPTAR